MNNLCYLHVCVTPMTELGASNMMHETVIIIYYSFNFRQPVHLSTCVCACVLSFLATTILGSTIVTGIGEVIHRIQRSECTF